MTTKGKRSPTSRLVALGAVVLLQVALVDAAQDPAQQGSVAGPDLSDVDVAKARAMGVVFDYDTSPKPRKTRRPKYPKSAFKKGIDGSVLVQIVIDRKGRVVDTRILESIPELDEAALECIRGWRFTPATKNGNPVASMARVPITFKIKAGNTPAETQAPERPDEGPIEAMIVSG
jgi:TonB family protein